MIRRNKNSMEDLLRSDAIDLNSSEHALPVVEKVEVPRIVREMFRDSTLDLIAPGTAAQEIFESHNYSYVIRLIRRGAIRSFNIDGRIFVSRSDCVEYATGDGERRQSVANKIKAWEERNKREKRCPTCGRGMPGWQFELLIKKIEARRKKTLAGVTSNND